MAMLVDCTKAAVLTLTIGFFVFIWKSVRRHAGKRLPPGPPGEPILGHLRKMPSYALEYVFMEWSKEHKSDILYFNILGQDVVVLNGIQPAIDLLDKRGANYSDRPRFVLFEIMGWRKTLTFLRYGTSFKLHRRILQRSLQKSSIVKHRALQEKEALVLLKGLVAKPERWETILRRFATAVVLGIGFGVEIQSDNDPFIQMSADSSYALGNGGSPAGTPVDFFPVLRHLPYWLADRSLRFARDWNWAIRQIHDAPFAAVQSGHSQASSLTLAMLQLRESQIERGETPELSIEDIKGAAAAVYAAGQDTTWATLLVFTLNMVLHPDVQAKARRQLDQVVGLDRLPTFQDRPLLGYIDNIVQEVLRWCPVSPVGIPHRSLEDDEYNGYFIPKGSFVYANARAMTHDERRYSDPDTFDPDRYEPVGSGGRGEPYPVGQFGFGRRVCVGQHLAEASVWIVIASLLSTMTIEKPLGPDGQEYEPDVGLTQGLTSHPEHFECRFVPRSAKAASLVLNTVI